METNGGGWTLIQRRKVGLTSFNRDWKHYKNGFGSIRGDFWLGNDHIFRLTRQPSVLRIEMEVGIGKQGPRVSLGRDTQEQENTTSSASFRSATRLHKRASLNHLRFPNAGLAGRDALRSIWLFHRGQRAEQLQALPRQLQWERWGLSALPQQHQLQHHQQGQRQVRGRLRFPAQR